MSSKASAKRNIFLSLSRQDLHTDAVTYMEFQDICSLKRAQDTTYQQFYAENTRQAGHRAVMPARAWRREQRATKTRLERIQAERDGIKDAILSAKVRLTFMAEQDSQRALHADDDASTTISGD